MKKNKFADESADLYTCRTNDDTLAAWIRLTSVCLPPQKLATLLQHYAYDPCALLDDSDHSLQALGVNQEQLARLHEECKTDKARLVAQMHRLGMRVVTLADDENYPPALRTIPDPPAVFYIRGAISSDDQFAVGIVGSRKATAYGLSLARQFGRELATGGLCIVSGGALGIDTEAHQGALDGGGRTLSIHGCGLDRYYPTENTKLFQRIVDEDRGALISEYAPGSQAEPWHFPARNRIISGLAMGVLLIETPVQSGAMITAHQAVEQGRDVMAIPGPIDEGRSSGCHRLIQEGARLVQSVDDIFEEIGILKLKIAKPVATGKKTVPAPPKSTCNLTDSQKRIVEQLTLEPKTLDQIAEGAELSARDVSSSLTILELNRMARKIGGQGFVRVL